ncbi:MAG: PD40 domain-containing protein [Burkholderiales bacterium]|nr:PD40 domain-containing protein [Burkholderiales bacterium]
MKRINRAPWWAWVLACACALSACGGGGGTTPAAANVAAQPPGDGEGDGGVPQPAAPDDVTAAANSGLSGRIYYDSAYGAVIMDLESGRGTLFSDLKGLRPSADGTEILDVTHKEGNDQIDQLRIRDEDGRTRSLFEVSTSLSGPRLSPDGQTIAAWWSNEAETGSYANSVLTLFSRTGVVLAQLPDATSFNWMPDGHLLYAIGPDLFRVNAAGGALVHVATLPAKVQGLSVSPNGQRLALQLMGPKTAVDESHIWSMNLDGTGLRQMTYSSINETDPIWIGDGSWLLAREGVLTSVLGYAGCPDLYAIPADADMVELTTARVTRAVNIKTRPFKTNGANAVCPFSTVAWAPLSRIAPSGGSLLADNGLINRGLGGVMAFQSGYRSLKEARNWLLDVRTGTKTEINNLIDGFDASRDGLWLASTAILETDSHSHTSELVIRDLQGKLVQRFEKPGWLSGPVRFSPDGKRLLFTWSTREADTVIWTDHIVVADMTGDIVLAVAGYQAADWVADGGLVLADPKGLYRVDPGFNTATPFVSLSDPIHQVRVSPDSRSVAFSMLNRVWVVQLDGSGLHRLTQSDGGESWPEWSPDGRHVAVAYREDPSSSAYWSYAWVVAADARGATVGLEGWERHAFPIRDGAGGQVVKTPMTTRFSWR